MKIISNKSKHNIIDPRRRDGEGIMEEQEQR